MTPVKFSRRVFCRVAVRNYSQCPGRRAAGVSPYGRLTTNPVYVVDLGFLLPAMVITGILLLRRHSTGFLLTPGMLIFEAVFGLAVTGKFVSMAIQGEAFDAIMVVLMSQVVLVFLVVLILFLKDSRSDVSLDEVLKDRQALSAGSPE